MHFGRPADLCAGLPRDLGRFVPAPDQTAGIDQRFEPRTFARTKAPFHSENVKIVAAICLPPIAR
jgi:hypothetical protein